MPKPNDNYPNFTLGSDKPEPQAAGLNASAVLSGVAATSSLISLPVALLIGAVAGGGLIAAKISKDKSALQSPIDEAEKKELQEFIFNHGVTIEMTKDLGLKFPPGHPRIDMLYKRHPLADVAGADKEKVYIPHDKYDEILMAEREAELLKLLVHLGATKITITHDLARSDTRNIEASLTAKASKLGEGEIKTSITSDERTSSLDKRVFRLSGKGWRIGDKLDRQGFSWISFEPSWEALIIAREIGGCTAAALDIRENTSFSTDKSFTTKVEYAVYSGSAAAAAEKSLIQEKIYLVEAEFGEVQPSTA